MTIAVRPVARERPTNRKWFPSPCVPMCACAVSITLGWSRNGFARNPSSSFSETVKRRPCGRPPGPKWVIAWAASSTAVGSA